MVPDAAGATVRSVGGACSARAARDTLRRSKRPPLHQIQMVADLLLSDATSHRMERKRLRCKPWRGRRVRSCASGSAGRGRVQGRRRSRGGGGDDRGADFGQLFPDHQLIGEEGIARTAARRRFSVGRRSPRRNDQLRPRLSALCRSACSTPMASPSAWSTTHARQTLSLAERGGGAAYGRPIRVSTVDALIRSLLGRRSPTT